MTKKGFTLINVDVDMFNEIEHIKDLEGCKSKTETLRQILRVYREARGLDPLRNAAIGKASTSAKAKFMIPKDDALGPIPDGLGRIRTEETLGSQLIRLAIAPGGAV